MVPMIEKTKRWHIAAPLSCVILIVDDSEEDRLACRRYLESSNILACDIYDCALGEDVLEFCNRCQPDIILLDYLLPDTDGLELLQELSEQLGTLPPIIMLTGQGDEAVAVKAMKHGARDYLIKRQLTPEKLTKSVVSVVTERRLQLRLNQQRQQHELLANIALRISHSVEPSQILQTAVEGARVLLECDRTLVYCFAPDMSGTFVSESVLSEWTAVLGNCLEKHCFQDKQVYSIKKYLQSHKMVISNTESSDQTADYVQMFKQFQIKANLVVPILCRDLSTPSESRLWGLLIAQHCKTAHEWKMDELSLMDELSVQMAIAIQQAELVSGLKAGIEKQQAIEYQLRERAAELEQSNLSLARATLLLKQRNQELDEFAYIASHDLKAPLRGIANLSKWLVEDLQDQLPSESKQQLELIQRQILRMDALINDLLQYSRVGKDNVETVSVNISQLLEEVVELLAPLTEFQIQFPPDLTTIETRARLLKQVFSNLIGNAIKHHTRTNGKVEIWVQDQGTFLQFTVADDGPGIAPEYHQEIFGAFKMLANGDDKQGTGIGLAIIKKIVESQGGSVWVESEVEQGSAFSFTWPKDTPID